jgi:orotate phosphoribosyltransferase
VSAADFRREALAVGLNQSRAQQLRELANDIESAAYLRGDFVLSSGMRSNYYFDKYLFETKPSILRRISALLVELVPPGIDRIAGPELGAVPLATALSLEIGIPFAIVRKGGKDYATGRLVEGELYEGERVVVVEDVISTGSQAIRAANQLRSVGAEVVGIIGVIDREQGGPENIAAVGYHFQALFRRRELVRI